MPALADGCVPPLRQVVDEVDLHDAAGKAERGTLDGVALGLPALTRAIKLQNRAARVGFDWPGPAQVLDKIAEERAKEGV